MYHGDRLPQIQTEDFSLRELNTSNVGKKKEIKNNEVNSA